MIFISKRIKKERITMGNTQSYSYGRALVVAIEEEQNDAGGTAIKIDGAFKSADVDYNDINNVRVMATYAIKTANGIADLIHEKIDISNPLSQNGNLELYIALAALASEIYMKAIIYYSNNHNGKIIRRHHLCNLYKQLPKATRDSLEKELPEIPKYLESISNAFMEMRYFFEFNAFNNEYLFVFKLLKALENHTKRYEMYELPLLKYAGGALLVE